MKQHYNNNYDLSYGYGNTPTYPLSNNRAFGASKQANLKEHGRSWHKDLDLIILDLPIEDDDYASYGSGGPAQAYQAG